MASQDAAEFLPPIFVQAMQAAIERSENRISRLLFKLAVEQDMMMNVLAAGLEINTEALDDLPERLPRSRQKEFKRIKNLIIQEAVKLNVAEPEIQATQTAGAHKKEPPPFSIQPAKQKHSSAAPLVRCASALLHHMGSIFREQGPQTAEMVVGVDSKLRRVIREKKIAMGHRPDDHE